MREQKTCIDDGWRIPDQLWNRLQPLLPTKPIQPKGGRSWTDDRRAMDGIFYLLRTGGQWKALPREFGASSTVHDRYQIWRGAGVFEHWWQAGLLEYDVLKGIDWQWQSAVHGWGHDQGPTGGERPRDPTPPTEGRVGSNAPC